MSLFHRDISNFVTLDLQRVSNKPELNSQLTLYLFLQLSPTRLFLSTINVDSPKDCNRAPRLRPAWPKIGQSKRYNLSNLMIDED